VVTHEHKANGIAQCVTLVWSSLEEIECPFYQRPIYPYNSNFWMVDDAANERYCMNSVEPACCRKRLELRQHMAMR
jgi:hypothetical protein